MAEKETTLTVFSPSYLINMFAAQRALVLDSTYDGAGTIRKMVATPDGVVITFDQGKSARRMLVSAHGWGWLA